MGSVGSVNRTGRRLALLLLFLAAASCTDNAAPPAPARTVPPSQKPPPAGLVGYWSFDQAGATLPDESDNGNTATVHGAEPIDGKVGLAYQFDGTACITAPDSSSLAMVNGTALSLIAWVNLPLAMTCPQDRLDAGFINWGVIVAKNGEYEHGVYCGGMPLYQESISTSGDGGAWVWNGATPLTQGSWHHVAITWDGTTVRHYLDGVQVDSRAVAGKLKTAFGVTGLTIGCGNAQGDGSSPGGYPFIGTIDEVALYQRALGLDEITAYYAATK